MTPANFGSVSATCTNCGFRYYEYNGHIIACPVCALARHQTEAGPSIEAINSARYVMYHARDFGEHEAILANEIMRLDVNKQQDK